MLERTLLLVCLLVGSSVVMADEDANKGALAAMDAFLAAFNARDANAQADTLNYPHVRIASGRVNYYPDKAAFVAASVANVPRLIEAEGWHHSTWDDMQIVQSSADKVHIAVVFSRYHENGERYVSHRSLYVVDNVDGHWGVRARSSFAP